MDLHVRSVSPATRSVTSGRSQPIRLQAAKSVVAVTPTDVETVPTFQPINRARSGAFAYEQGAFDLAGQTEVDADGTPQVRGTARFHQGSLHLESEGRFVLGYDGPETALIGEGDFAWHDGRGRPITGHGTISVRQDAIGNSLIQLTGVLKTRHQTIDIEGPAGAEIDARADGSFVVRLKGQARFGTPLATIEGELDLTYGEIEGERLNVVSIHGRTQTLTDYLNTEGEGRFDRRTAYGSPGTVLTVSGPGTYRHGTLECQGQIHLRIVPHGQTEAYDGTIRGAGHYNGEGVAASGLVSGRFFQQGEQHDFEGTVTGTLATLATGISGEGEGALALHLTSQTTAWDAAMDGGTQWPGPGGTVGMPQSLWRRHVDGSTSITGTGDLQTDHGPWACRLSGEIVLQDDGERVSLTATGDLEGRALGTVGLCGPGSAAFAEGWWQVTGQTDDQAVVEGMVLAKNAPTAFEYGTLPDGQPFWHLQLGGPKRQLVVGIKEHDGGLMGLFRTIDPMGAKTVLRPLTGAETLAPQVPDREPDGEAQP